jgi:hypothetical protein
MAGSGPGFLDKIVLATVHKDMMVVISQLGREIQDPGFDPAPFSRAVDKGYVHCGCVVAVDAEGRILSALLE